MIVKRLLGSASGWQFAARPGYLSFALFAVGLCLCLSFWQWQRAESADARYQQFVQQQSQPATHWHGGQPAPYEALKASGQLQQLFLLDNQIRQGIVGWHVLGLLATDYGTLLLNLGWQSARDLRPTLNNFPSVMTVSGLAVYPEVGLMLAPAEDDPAWPGIMQQIDIPLLRQRLGAKLADFMIVVNTPGTGLATVHAAPDNKSAMHIGYALQWLLIAVACLTVFYFACRGEKNDP